MRRLPYRPLAILLVPLLIVVATIWFFIGQGRRTEPDSVPVDVTPTELLSAADFEFTFGDGSGLRGYDVVKVEADNSCQYTFMDGYTADRKQRWRRANFNLDRQTVNDLRQLLNDVEYFRLKGAYWNTRVQDGTQRFVKVAASGKKKGVYCSNYFPSEIEQIRLFIQRRIIESHRKETGSAPVISITAKEVEPDEFP